MAAYQKANRPIVYLDESGFKHHAYRPNGYSARGQPCHGTHNWHLRNTTNAVAAWSDNQLLAPFLVEGTFNSDVFFAWITQGLIPELPANSVIVMDNAPFHKRADIVDELENAGHEILWLPPYSPDLNPIEEVWAWIKSARKRWKMDVISDLFFYFCWIINGDQFVPENI